MIRNAEAYRKAFAIANSPALGMEFCVGCWLEGGKRFGNLLDGIREFQADGRIVIVHFRNVTSTLPEFVETFLDNGYMDMRVVMQTLVESGYRGTITLDHTPSLWATMLKAAARPLALPICERCSSALHGPVTLMDCSR